MFYFYFTETIRECFSGKLILYYQVMIAVQNKIQPQKDFIIMIFQVIQSVQLNSNS